MNNTVEFAIKMRDMMSSGLGRLSSTAQSSFNRMSQSAQGMTQRNQVLGLSFNELQKKIQQTEATIKSSTIPSQIAEARRELASLQAQSSRHAGNIGGRSSTGSSSSGSGSGVASVAIGNMISGVAMRAGSMIVSAVGSGVSTMIVKSMEKEQAIIGLTTFLGKKGAEDAYKNIRKDADNTPYDTASLLQVNRALISAQVNAKDARRDTMNLANAVSAVGGGNDTLTRMALNMQQIKTVGKATAMDIRQFGFAGINIYEMLSRSTGKSIAQVKEMDVTYQMLSKSLEMAQGKGGIYEGALENQSKSKLGKWDTFKDNITSGLVDIGDAFSPIIDKVLTIAKDFTNGIAPALEQAKPYIDGISNSLGTAIDYVMEIINGTSEWSEWIEIAKNNFGIVWQHVQRVLSAVWHIVSGIIEFIKKSEILKDVFTFIGWMMEKTYGLIGGLLDGIVWLWDNIVKPIIEAIDKAYKWIKGVDDVEVKVTKTIVPKKPKDDPNAPSALATNNQLARSNENSGKSAGDTVVGGGQKVVNINVGKFFDTIQFTTMNSNESAQEIEKIVTECIARVVYNGAKLV